MTGGDWGMGKPGPRLRNSGSGTFSTISDIYIVLGAKAGKRTRDPIVKGLACWAQKHEGHKKPMLSSRKSVRK